MKRFLIAAFVAAAAAPGVAWPSVSRADETPSEADGPARGETASETSWNYHLPAPLFAEQPGYTGPNRTVLATGLIAFGGAYVPSVIVGATSDEPEDRRLYVPVVGPWLDLAHRPACGFGTTSCARETTDKVLLVASGAVQGAGVLAVLASFAFPERLGYITATSRGRRNTANRVDEVTLHVAPTQLGAGGYGLVAFGGF
jgi:hypothetical protein